MLKLAVEELGISQAALNTVRPLIAKRHRTRQRSRTLSDQTISVVIVAYNEASELNKCLTSIKEHEPLLPPEKIIVVDNSTAEAVREMISRSHFDITYISNLNRGFGAGNNRGVAAARDDFILFLNPDTQLTQALIRPLISEFERTPNLGALGMRIVGPDGGRQQSFFWINGGGILRGITQHLLNRAGLFIPKYMCTSAAALAVRRSAFVAAGQFDERIFLYCEEVDLARRLNRKGWRWRFLPSAQIAHIGGATTAPNAFFAAERLKSLRYYCQKYGLNYGARLRRELRYRRVANAVKRITAPALAAESGDFDAIAGLYRGAIKQESKRARSG